MPEFKIRTPEGRYFNVTVPPGTSKEEALAYAQAHMPAPTGALDLAPNVYSPGTEPGGIYDRIKSAVSRASGGLLESPKGFRGPGLLSNLGSAIQGATKGASAENPQQVYDRTIPAFETMADIFGTLGLPAGHALTRMVTGVGVPAGIALLGGKDPLQRGIEGGAGQGIAEILSGAGRMGRLGSLANTARAEFEKKMAAQAGKVAHDKSMLSALETLDAQRHEKLVSQLTQQHADLKGKMEGEYAQQMSSREDLMASAIMEHAKASVPAWREFPSTAAGLYSAVLGKGKELLSSAFDAALEAAKGTARGKTVNIPVSDVKTLDIAVKAGTDRVLPKGDTDLRMLVPVDAAELIDRLPGLKNRALKARAQQALSEKDLGISPEALTEYRVGKGTIEMADENKIFKWDEASKTHSVDADALAKGLLSREHMDTVQDRGMGHFDTYPGLKAAKSGPQAPTIPPLTLPEKPAPRGPLGSPPPLISPDDSGAIKEITLPGSRYSRGAVTAGALGTLGGLFGAHHGAGSGVLGAGGGALGYGLGASLPDKIITKTPMSSREEVLMELLPLLLGSGLRNAGASASATGRSPEELAAIDAEINAAAGARDPNLQLDITPTE